MRRHRWPAVPAPTTGGLPIHGPRVLVALPGMLLQLTTILAYPTGLEIRMVFTAIGVAAERARHETRALTDPADTSARWSYLQTWVCLDTLAGQADPFHPLTGSLDTAAVNQYRTAPRYWINTSPHSHMLTITTEWIRVGLSPSRTTVQLGANPSTLSTEH